MNTDGVGGGGWSHAALMKGHEPGIYFISASLNIPIRWRTKIHCKKGYRFSHLSQELFPSMESLVSDFPAGDGKIDNLFLQCTVFPSEISDKERKPILFPSIAGDCEICILCRNSAKIREKFFLPYSTGFYCTHSLIYLLHGTHSTKAEKHQERNQAEQHQHNIQYEQSPSS
jgi:hypothetical protein